MQHRPRLAVIGAGNMGAAILRGLLRAGWPPQDLMATAPREARLEELRGELGVHTSTANAEGARFAEVLVLGIKPQILVKVLDEIRAELKLGTLVISLAAGVPTWAIEKHLPPETAVVRTMPNLPVLVAAGATAMCPGSHATKQHLELARHLFESVGNVVETSEDLMDAVTGLSGTGPMYVFQFIEGLSDAGVKVGLSRHVSNELALQTVVGAARMAQQVRQHPATLKDMVTSPGGTAIAALHSLERSGLRATLMDAVEAATARSRELGQRYAEPK